MKTYELRLLSGISSMKNTNIFKPKYANTDEWYTMEIDSILYREDQINQVKDALENNISGNKNSGTIVFGPAGTGKTTVVNLIIEQLLQDERVQNNDFNYYYLNCSSFEDIVPILQELVHIIFSESKLECDRIDDLASFLNQKLECCEQTYILVFDDIKNQYMISSLIEIFKDNSNVNVVGILNDIYLNESPNTTVIPFLPYDQDQMYNIIFRAATELFYPGSYTERELMKIPKYDDLGKNIELLLNAARVAESMNKHQIDLDSIVTAERLIEARLLSLKLTALSMHSKLVLMSLLYCQRLYDEIRVNELNNIYYRMCLQTNETCKSLRYVSEALLELANLEFIELKKIDTCRNQNIPYDVFLIRNSDDVLNSIFSDEKLEPIEKMFKLEFN